MNDTFYPVLVQVGCVALVALVGFDGGFRVRPCLFYCNSSPCVRYNSQNSNFNSRFPREGSGFAIFRFRLVTKSNSSIFFEEALTRPEKVRRSDIQKFAELG